MSFKDETEFESWCKTVGYNDLTTNLIRRIRASPPSRNVTGGRGNMRGRLPSHKMGKTIQSESRTAEKPGSRIFYEYDHLLESSSEAQVLEYYDQPDQIALRYVSATGRAVTAWHTPDFFVIRANGAGWEEWKTENELALLAQKQPARYHRDETGQWRCPPGETYAAAFGLYYRLRSNAEVNWTLFSNVEFLHEYLVVEESFVPANALTVIDRVRQQQGLTLAALLLEQSADEVYLLIAQRQIYVDLQRERLVEPTRVQVYTSRSAADAYQNVSTTKPPYMHTKTPASDVHPAYWIAASEQDYAIANARLRVLQALETGMTLEQIWQLEEVGSVLGVRKSLRTVRFWQQQFRGAERQWGSGYVGLLPICSHARSD